MLLFKYMFMYIQMCSNATQSGKLSQQVKNDNKIYFSPLFCNILFNTILLILLQYLLLYLAYAMSHFCRYNL